MVEGTNLGVHIPKNATRTVKCGGLNILFFGAKKKVSKKTPVSKAGQKKNGEGGRKEG